MEKIITYRQFHDYPDETDEYIKMKKKYGKSSLKCKQYRYKAKFDIDYNMDFFYPEFDRWDEWNINFYFVYKINNKELMFQFYLKDLAKYKKFFKTWKLEEPLKSKIKFINLSN